MAIPRRTINGRSVNPVGLGCMSLSWAYGMPPAEEDASRLLLRALDLGYDHLDTARLYGQGHNEELIGKTLSHRRNEFFLASKTGLIADGDKRRADSRPETIRQQLEISLRLLKTDHIDLYYLHRRDFNTPIEESVGALADLIKEGKIGAIGLSEMSADTLRRASTVHPIAAMQTEYSLMTLNPEIAVLEACRELGTTFVSFSPVGRGALAGKVGVSDLPPHDIRRTMPRFQGANWENNRALFDSFFALAKREGVTPAQLCMAWVLSRGDHVVTIPGTSRIDHMEENIARWDWEIPADLAAEAEALINRHSVAGARYPANMQATVETEVFEDEVLEPQPA